MDDSLASSTPLREVGAKLVVAVHHTCRTPGGFPLSDVHTESGCVPSSDRTSAKRVMHGGPHRSGFAALDPP